MRPAAVCLAIAASLVAMPCLAESFRCPNGNLVQTGDTLASVSIHCDAPARVDRRTESADGVSSVEIEEWTYNFGPTGFLYTLVFRNGRLVEVQMNGRGQ